MLMKNTELTKYKYEYVKHIDKHVHIYLIHIYVLVLNY